MDSFSSQDVTSVERENWFQKYWRPMMAYVYAVICVFDFVAAPILNALFFAYTKFHYVAWVPLTLQNGGLFHLSMGAIIGVYTYNRTQEKMSFARMGFNGPQVEESEKTTDTVTKKESEKSSRAD